MRLAELHFQKANEQVTEQSQKDEQVLTESSDSPIDDELQEPQRDLSKALGNYERLINQAPHSNLGDAAEDTKGYISEEPDQQEAALQIYNYINKHLTTAVIDNLLEVTASDAVPHS